MGLEETYASIEPAIVAITSIYAETNRAGEPPAYPPIIGSGFVVDSSGVVATNRHVVMAVAKRAERFGHEGAGVAAVAVLRRLSDEGLREFPLEITRVITVSDFDEPVPAIRRQLPDLALLKVRSRELESVSLHTGVVRPGTEIATAGFPMGTKALTAFGWLHQATPTLQRGVISALLPFEQEELDGYAINVMVQGGASGSPVFRVSDGGVIGVLYSILRAGPTEPTNISYVVPSLHLQRSMEWARSQGLFDEDTEAPTLEEIAAAASPLDLSTGSLPWVRVDSPRNEGKADT